MTESVTPAPIQEPVSVDDNAGELTVDGTVTANLSATDNAVLDAIEVDTTTLAGAVGGTEMQVDVVAALPTGANAIGKLAANSGVDIGDVDVLSIAAGDNNIGNVDIASPLGAGLEATALRVTVASYSTGLVSVDDNGGALTVDWAGTAPPIGAGLEATALRVTLATDSSGLVSVDDNAGSLTVDNAALAVTGGGVEATALRVTIASDSTGVLSIDDNAASLTVDVGTALPAGANNIGDVDVLTLPSIPAGINNIGDVDVLTIAAGDNNIGNVDIVTLPNVTLAAGTNTNEVVGDVAHYAGVAGNPVLVCGVAQNADDTAPPNRVSAEADATRLATDRDGALFVRPYGPQVWSYHENSSSALTDASVHVLPGAGLSLYVTDIVVSTGAATAMNIFFEEGASTVLGPWYLEAVAGRGLAIHFQTPKKITANTALTVTTSAAIAHSIDVTGFTAQG